MDSGIASKLGLVALIGALAALPAGAVPLPKRAQWQAQLAAPVSVSVVEPHLSTPSRPQRVTYRGWPAQRVLDHLLGTAWRAPGAEVEFRALDGFVSRIPSSRFLQHDAYLVFARVDGAAFTVNNHAQNEKNVPLGPYYLVWQNTGKPDLIAEGGTYWPYQVAEILVSTARKSALTPSGLPAALHAQADQVQKLCLSCHQVNGYGGAKWPGNLAEQARRLDRNAFTQWVIEPGRVKPGTTMPGLSAHLPLAQREQMAKDMFDYLTQVPLLPER